MSRIETGKKLKNKIVVLYISCTGETKAKVFDKLSKAQDFQESGVVVKGVLTFKNCSKKFIYENIDSLYFNEGIDLTEVLKM